MHIHVLSLVCFTDQPTPNVLECVLHRFGLVCIFIPKKIILQLIKKSQH